MSLQHWADPSAGAWIATAEADGNTLVTLGPPAFEAYARVAFPTSPEQPHWRPETEVMADLVALLAPYTRTPDTAWFGLWDGWGDIEGQEAARYVAAVGDQSSWFGRFFRTPRNIHHIPPAFDAAVIEAPRLAVPVDDPQREFLLFRGQLGQAGDWGAEPLGPGWPPRDISVPNLMWPDDRAWCVAADVAVEWIGVGGSRRAIDAIVRDEALTGQEVAYTDHPATWESA